MAREDFAKAHPELLAHLRELLRGQVDVHHRIPLDFAHLFPFRDINALENLAAVEPKVHYGINAVWGRYADRVGAGATAAEVGAVSKLIEKHFARWYSSTRYVPASPEMVQQSIRKALQELDALLIQAGK